MNNNNETMEKRKYYTLVRPDITLAEDEALVIGKIAVLKEVYCDRKFNGEDLPLYADRHDERGWLISSECSSKEYDDFVKVVSALYPNLCVFNYDVANE